MLKRFPGRTLEELDRIDWGRYLRAMEAEHIGNIEEKRQAQISGIIEPKNITAAEWEAIEIHTEWIEGLDGD